VSAVNWNERLAGAWPSRAKVVALSTCATIRAWKVLVTWAVAPKMRVTRAPGSQRGRWTLAEMPLLKVFVTAM
jgi:hypothetical protein